MLPQEVLVPVDFGLGIDQDADEKQTIPGKLLRAENMRLEKRKRASKRYGYSRVGSGANLLNGDVLIASGKQLVALKQNSSATPDQIFGPGNASYLSGAIVALGKRNAECSVAVSSVRSDQAQQTNIDVAIIGNLAFYVSDGCFYRLVDNDTGEVIVSETAIGNGTDAMSVARVIALSGSFVVGVRNITTGNLEFRAMDPSVTTALPTAAASSLAIAGDAWDWNIYGTALVVARQTAGPQIAVNRVSAAGAVLTSVAFAVGSAAVVVGVCTPQTTASTILRVVWYDAVNGLQVRYFNPATLANHATLGGATMVITAAIGGATAYVVDSAESPSGANFVVSFTHIVPPTTSFITTTRFVNDGNPAVTIVATKTSRSAFLSSRLFLRNGRVYGIVTNWFALSGSSLQPAHFLYEWDSVSATNRIVARFFRGVAAPNGNKTAVLLTSADVFQVTLLRLERGTLSGSAALVSRAAKVALDFNALGNNAYVELADSTLVSGGFLAEFDGGRNLVEHGFFLFPEGASGVAAAAGALSAGSYQYAICYEWNDARGKLHRSTPSTPITVVAAAGQRFNLTIPTCHQTNKSGATGINEGRLDFWISIFRTVANGTTFYRLTDIPSAALNNVAVETIAFADNTIADSTLISREILYTTGGEFGNVTPDGPTAIAAGNDRVFCNDVSDDGVVWFSKQIIQGEAVSFSAELYKRMSTDGGPVRAIAVMDKREIMFKRREVWVMAGNGPGPNGQGDNFSDPERLNVDGGCIRQTACVVTPIGVIVKNDAGFYLLGRDFSWRHIGVAVRDLEQYDVRRAVLVPDKHEVRFVLSNGTLLHYNYEFTDEQGNGQWYQSNFSALDAAFVDGSFYVVESTTKNVYREDSTRFTDEALGGGGSAAAISMLLETANIAVSGINGFQCLWAIYLLGRFRSAHTLNIEIAYDQKDAYEPAAFTIDGATATAGGEAYRIQIEPRIQECTAFRLRISDTPTGGSGESFDLTAMTLSVGALGGGARLRMAQRTG